MECRSRVDNISAGARFNRRSDTMQILRKIAMRYPEVEEGTVCNKTAFKVRNKGFLFVGSDDNSYNVMLKLGDSLPQAAKLAAQTPAGYKVGSNGWVTATFEKDQTPRADLFEKWIDESFRLIAPKQVLALLPESRGSMASSLKTPKRKN
jgi:predicted DNA-binding protein (MmcQ/YjbR family)